MKYNLIFFFFFWFGAAVWSSHFLTVFVILTHITWAPVLFGRGSLAVSSLRMRPGPLQTSWELCYRQLYLSLISPLPQSLFSPSPPSHHRTLLHHACNYGVTGEMSVAKFSLAVRVGNWGFRAIQLEFSGLVTPLASLTWSWSGGLIVESQPPSLVRTYHLCFGYESHFSPYVTICLVPVLHDMTFNLTDTWACAIQSVLFSTFVFLFY